MDNWNYKVFWDEAIHQAKTELGEHEFAMWFNIRYDSSTENSVIVAVPSNFYRDQLIKQYQKYLENKLFDITGKRLIVDFIVKKPSEDSAYQEGCT
jgi:chromosomal replication initiator protein